MKKWFWVFLTLAILCIVSFAVADVAINSDNFPDPNFQNVVRAFDRDGNGELSDKEQVLYIDCFSQSISSLKGIEYFIHLEGLNCSDNRITSLDLSKNTALKNLNCSGNQLTSLDLSKNTALSGLSCQGNLLTSLDVSKNVSLENLVCNNNALKLLNVENNTMLNFLICSDNLLTSLDVSKNVSLERLECKNNMLELLNVGKNTVLMYLRCEENHLPSLDVSQCTYLNEMVGTGDGDRGEYRLWQMDIDGDGMVEQLAVDKYTAINTTVDVPEDVMINNTNFPDDNFRSIIQGYDKDGNGVLSWWENWKIKDIIHSEKPISISSLKGIEFLYYLEKLSCNGHNLKNLDVSKNVFLEELYCNNNMLTNLDVSKNISLEVLYCTDNMLTNLDVSKNVSLKTLECRTNKLESLTLGKKPELKWLVCSENHLLSLDLSQCPYMNELFETDPEAGHWTRDGDGDGIISNPNGGDMILAVGPRVAINRTVDVPKEVVINSKNFPDDHFRSIIQGKSYDKDGDGVLSAWENCWTVSISCANKSISSLKGIEHLIYLENLDCRSNNLSVLDISKNTKLKTLDCSKNSIKALDASRNADLTELNCSGNRISSLDISKQSKLEVLTCSDNELKSLDLKGKSNLKSVDCSKNNLTTVKFKNNTSLNSVNCGANSLTTLDLSDNTELTTLYCDHNQLKSLDVKGLNKLSTIICYSNNLEKLDVNQCSILKKLVKTVTPTTYKEDRNAYVWKGQITTGGREESCFLCADKKTKVIPSSVEPDASDGPDASNDSGNSETSKISISKCDISSIKNQTYTGKKLEPSITIKYGSKKLKNGTDYTVAYKNNTEVGKATATITGKGKYSGSKSVNFTIEPAPVKLTSLKGESKKLKATWKQGEGIDGYEIEYSLHKDFQDAGKVKVKKAGTTEITIKKLEANRKYYVRVRAYKSVKGKTYYSEWSGIVSAKVKK